MISYHEFLKRKRDTEPPDGIDVPEGTLHPDCSTGRNASSHGRSR